MDCAVSADDLYSALRGSSSEDEKRALLANASLATLLDLLALVSKDTDYDERARTVALIFERPCSLDLGEMLIRRLEAARQWDEADYWGDVFVELADHVPQIVPRVRQLAIGYGRAHRVHEPVPVFRPEKAVWTDRCTNSCFPIKDGAEEWQEPESEDTSPDEWGLALFRDLLLRVTGEDVTRAPLAVRVRPRGAGA